MNVINFIRLVTFLVVISFIVVNFTMGFGWLGDILRGILLILTLIFDIIKLKKTKSLIGNSDRSLYKKSLMYRTNDIAFFSPLYIK
ncbi:hypothetical protein EEO23_03100 [Staphylococcus pseudintermedius]|nr:hypothetical protein [Staphylococcus pseudintermedius]EGQ4364664.1 hypothetical protein [Staphylococcus pseudintermedius]EGQ4440434.1 hypothetical protein [Staphylococcus pseudintermedius]